MPYYPPANNTQTGNGNDLYLRGSNGVYDGDLTVTGELNVDGIINALGSLDVTGVTNLGADLNVTGPLTVTGDTLLNGLFGGSFLGTIGSFVFPVGFSDQISQKVNFKVGNLLIQAGIGRFPAGPPVCAGILQSNYPQIYNVAGEYVGSSACVFVAIESGTSPLLRAHIIDDPSGPQVNKLSVVPADATTATEGLLFSWLAFGPATLPASEMVVPSTPPAEVV